MGIFHCATVSLLQIAHLNPFEDSITGHRSKKLFLFSSAVGCFLQLLEWSPFPKNTKLWLMMFVIDVSLTFSCNRAKIWVWALGTIYQ